MNVDWEGFILLVFLITHVCQDLHTTRHPENSFFYQLGQGGQNILSAEKDLQDREQGRAGSVIIRPIETGISFDERSRVSAVLLGAQGVRDKAQDRFFTVLIGHFFFLGRGLRGEIK